MKNDVGRIKKKGTKYFVLSHTGHADKYVAIPFFFYILHNSGGLFKFSLVST